MPCKAYAYKIPDFILCIIFISKKVIYLRQIEDVFFWLLHFSL